MGVSGFEVAVPMKVDAQRLFNAAVMRIHEISHLICPTFFKEASIIEGCKEGGVGCVKLINMTDAYSSKTMKARVDHLDKKKLEVTYTLLEGSSIGEKLEKTKYHFRIFPSIVDGESVVIVSSEHHHLSGADFTDGELQKDKEFVIAAWKDIEKYLLEHPEF